MLKFRYWKTWDIMTENQISVFSDTLRIHQVWDKGLISCDPASKFDALPGWCALASICKITKIQRPRCNRISAKNTDPIIYGF
jgi:hypothetical protein